MSASLRYQGYGSTSPDWTRTLFAQTMGYVAATAALFAAGAYLGRNLSSGAGIVAFIAAFVCLIAMRFAARRSQGLTVGLLAAFGVLIGVAVAPTLAYYASTNPDVLWKAGGATALFIAGFGSAGYATRRDLSSLARICFWALLALIVFGIAAIFVHIPHAQLAYSVLGLVIFAGFTMFDFQRLRRSQGGPNAAPLIAASIFLDILNVFLFFLSIFSGGRRN
jgi:FtsH-binding integral membrane protein